MDDLTNDQKFLLTSLYKHSLELQPGLSLEKANFFVDSNYVQENFVPQFSKEYVAALCWKLKAKEYISCTRGDNLANNIVLEDKTIIYMENSFKRNIPFIISFLKEIITIVK